MYQFKTIVELGEFQLCVPHKTVNERERRAREEERGWREREQRERKAHTHRIIVREGCVAICFFAFLLFSQM